MGKAPGGGEIAMGDWKSSTGIEEVVGEMRSCASKHPNRNEPRIVDKEGSLHRTDRVGREEVFSATVCE